jgi:hypothetical protein
MILCGSEGEYSGGCIMVILTHVVFQPSILTSTDFGDGRHGVPTSKSADLCGRESHIACADDPSERSESQIGYPLRMNADVSTY